MTDLVASLAALGRSVQGEFDPQRLLGGFSDRLQPLVPHDRALIAYVEDEEFHRVGGTATSPPTWG